MRHTSLMILGAFFLAACGGSQPADSPAVASSDEAVEAGGGEAGGEATGGEEADDENTFKVNSGTGKAGAVKGAKESKLKPTAELTPIKFTIVDRWIRTNGVSDSRSSSETNERRVGNAPSATWMIE